MATKAFAIVAGVGPGTGASVAKRFGKEYPVFLLARNPDNYESTVKEINSNGGKAIGISTDVTKADSVKAALDKIEQELPGASCAAAIFNAAAGFVRKDFLELSEAEFLSGYEVGIKGGFQFSQHALPYLLKGVNSAKHPPTLIFTGATASVKANARVASFASACHAKRALAISLAKEFAPQGIHVAHAVIDGPIDIPGRNDYRASIATEAKINPDDIAEASTPGYNPYAYWNLHTQSKRCFTNEIDIRTALEKW